MVEAAQEGATPIVFDIDDLLVEPELATFEAIDELRSQGVDLGGVRAFFEAQQRTLHAADVCSAPTPALAAACAVRERRLLSRLTASTMRRSHAAVGARRHAPRDGLTRIGYAAGTRTHQRDLAEAADALAARADVRLVLFKAGDFELVQAA